MAFTFYPGGGQLRDYGEMGINLVKENIKLYGRLLASKKEKLELLKDEK